MTGTKKTPAGKHGPCVKCGKTRFIADRDGRCHTCSRAAKVQVYGAATTPASPGDIQKGKAIVRAIAEKRKTESALDLTVKEVGQTGIPRIVGMMMAERDHHLAEADKLSKAITLLEGL